MIINLCKMKSSIFFIKIPLFSIPLRPPIYWNNMMSLEDFMDPTSVTFHTLGFKISWDLYIREFHMLIEGNNCFLKINRWFWLWLTHIEKNRKLFYIFAVLWKTILEERNDICFIRCIFSLIESLYTITSIRYRINGSSLIYHGCDSIKKLYIFLIRYLPCIHHLSELLSHRFERLWILYDVFSWRMIGWCYSYLPNSSLIHRVMISWIEHKKKIVDMEPRFEGQKKDQSFSGFLNDW